MSISKRDCRKYADMGLSFRKGDGLLLVGQINSIVRTTVRNIAGRRVLILYFYKREDVCKGNSNPEYTLFQCKDDYITLHKLENGKEKWRTASLYNLGDGYSYFTKGCAFYRQEDEQRVTRFCGKSPLTGFDALDSLQVSIMRKRLAARIKAREQKIICRMKPIPSVPRDFKCWIHREALPQYIFYEYARGAKPMQGYCTACRHDVLVQGAKHNGAGECPLCGKSVTFKAHGRAKKVWDRVTVQVINKIGENELVLRIFKINNWLFDYRRPDLSVWENARFFIRWDKDNKIRADAYYYSYGSAMLTNWKKGERPRFSLYQESFECDICGYLYCRNLDSVLADTPWKYCQLARFYNQDRKPLEVMPYLSAYHQYPAIEYLVKLGLTKLAAHVIYKHDGAKAINPGGGNLRETLGVEPEDLPFLQKVNVSALQMELYRELKILGIRADEDFLMWFQQRDIRDMDNVLFPLMYTTPGRLMRYVDEKYEQLKDLKTRYGARRYEGPNRVLSEYRDYLDMGSKLEYDFSDSFVLFPKNLPEAHDQASKLFDTRKKAIYNRQIREAYKSLLEQYRFTKNGLTLIPPKTAREIVAEGHALHHCVHSYVDRVAEGRCVILFVRKTDSMKEPFFTVELHDGKVTQIRGQQNCAPTPEVEKFLDHWKRRKLQPAKIAA